jgi:hypothetical protein
MLQPIPARPFFRFLELPLGLAAVTVGAPGLLVGASALLHRDWRLAGLFLVGPLLTAFGVLGVIHAASGCLPEWVVGRDDDDMPRSDSPAA